LHQASIEKKEKRLNSNGIAKRSLAPPRCCSIFACLHLSFLDGLLDFRIVCGRFLLLDTRNAYKGFSMLFAIESEQIAPVQVQPCG
jgi:hypothetical protein